MLGGPFVFAIPRDNLQRIEKPTMYARARSLVPLKTIESIGTIETRSLPAERQAACKADSCRSALRSRYDVGRGMMRNYGTNMRARARARTLVHIRASNAYPLQPCARNAKSNIVARAHEKSHFAAGNSLSRGPARRRNFIARNIVAAR